MISNPLSKLAPHLFGEYPREFTDLINLVQILPNQSSEEVKSQIWLAYEFGKRHHEGQKRKSGEPYFNHCVEVAKTLSLIHI